jgi:PKD repeat protein
MTNTILIPPASPGGFFIYIGGDASETAGTAITAGWALGSSNLTVASTSGLNVGQLVHCDQVMDTSVMWDKIGDGTARQINSMAQIKAINGNVVTIWPPLTYPAIANGNPLMKNYGSPNYQASYCGVEDLTIDSTGVSTGFGITLEQTIACWVKNVQSIKIGNYHMYSQRTVFNEFQKVFINDSPDYLPNHSGIILGNGSGAVTATATAIYDCIFNKILPGVEVNGGSSGCIVAYNYFRDPRYSTVAQSVGLCVNHGPCNTMNLYEGNIVNMIESDGYFGGSLYDTVFRNWSTGWTETFTNFNSRPISLARWALYANVVGNVFGCTNFVPMYYAPTNQLSYDYSMIYNLGFPNAAASSTYTNTRPPSTDRVNALDLNVTNTALIHGNWDSFNRAQVWRADIADHNIPNSLYLSSKPSWFGNLAWPPFDPAVGYTNLYWTSIPAGYRFINGVDPPGVGSNQPPVGQGSAVPLNGGAPLTVGFSSAGSFDPEGTTLTYTWTFGDGGTSTSANPLHTYLVVGVYSATLTVSDGVNTTTLPAITINVGVNGPNQPPIVVANAIPTSGSAPLLVTFSSIGSFDPQGTSLSYDWTFGDGGTSTAANPGYTYTTAGSFSARLSVSDGTNTTTSSPITITVTSPPPTVALTAPADGASFNAPATINCAASVTANSHTITQVRFYNGGALIGQASVSPYTFNWTNVAMGNYTLTAQAVYDAGATATSPPVTVSVGGLVAAYGFEEGSGSSTSDASGNANSGTISGPTWTNSGRSGTALSFPGTSASVVVNDSPTLDLTTELTLEAWVYPTATNGGFQSIVSKPLDPNYNQISYVLHGASRTNGLPSFALSVSPNNLFGPGPLPLNTWSHLAATYDGATMKLYVNGTLVASQPQTGSLSTSTQPVAIGLNWVGSIDEVRIYNRALSNAELQADTFRSVYGNPFPPGGLHVVGGGP